VDALTEFVAAPRRYIAEATLTPLIGQEDPSTVNRDNETHGPAAPRDAIVR